MATEEENDDLRITTDDIRAGEQLIGLEFDEEKREMMLKGVDEHLTKFEELRTVEIDNRIPPPLYFDPRLPGMEYATKRMPSAVSPVEPIAVPDDLEELAFCSVLELAALLREHHVTSKQLTEMYLRRLKHYDPMLNCVVTLTEDLALGQAR